MVDLILLVAIVLSLIVIVSCVLEFRRTNKRYNDTLVELDALKQKILEQLLVDEVSAKDIDEFMSKHEDLFNL